MSAAEADAYKNRESTSTRNPHGATKPVDRKALAKLSYEERILKQWQAASGTPISDEAKEQCKVFACGHITHLADVRVWPEMQSQRQRDKSSKGMIFLEFFFDGTTGELNGRDDEFKAAFESMIETQLQEVRIKEFRKRLTTRRRGGKAHDEDGVEGGASSLPGGDDNEWREYLKTPAPATELSVRSMRDAGCMLRFIVCQTSISISAAELLGQTCFQEHFPINGTPQDVPKDTKQLPRWAYFMLFCSSFLVLAAVVVLWNFGILLLRSPSNASNLVDGNAPVLSLDPLLAKQN